MQGEKLMIVFNFYKKRKAISTVIGAFFFIVIMAGAFTAFILMMETNSKFLNIQLGASQNELQKIQEKFVISACTDSDNGNRLKVFVENTGTVPVEIADLFVINKTMSTKAVKQFDINFNDAFVPGGQKKNILQTQTLTMVSTPNTYDLKVVSSLGNSEIISLPVADPDEPDNRLAIQLISIPPLITNNANVTILMTASNRGDHILYDVQPDVEAPNFAPTVTPSSITVLDVTQLEPRSIKQLNPTESVTFPWTYKIFGGIGSKINFTARAEAKLCSDTTTFDVKSATNSTRVTINEESNPSTIGPSQPFARPQFFIAFPNPYGSVAGGGDTGYFVLTVTNPTNTTLSVFSVNLALMFISTDDRQIIDSVTTADSIPTSGWTVAGGSSRNTITWRDLSSPITIPEFSTFSFRTAVVHDGVPASADFPIIVIATNALTSFGQFGIVDKVTFTKGSDGGNMPIPNIFHCKADPSQTGEVCPTASGSKTTLGNERLYNITGVPTGVPQRFNVTLVQSASAGTIDADSNLITVIPAGFLGIDKNLFRCSGDGNLGNRGSGTTCPDAVIKTIDDGSKQITVPVKTAMTAGQKATFSFSAIPPATDEKQMYLFFHLLSGGATGIRSLGSVSEVVIQTCGTLTGCD